MSNLPPPEYTLTSMMGNFISFRAKGFSHKKGDGLYTADQLRAFAEEAVRLEREACAKLCDERSQWIAGVIVPGLPEQFRGADSFANGSWQEAEACADAIRARSQEG